MVWTLTGREPRFPRIRTFLNWAALAALVAGAGLGVYYGWPLYGDSILEWFSGLFGGEVEAVK